MWIMYLCEVQAPLFSSYIAQSFHHHQGQFTTRTLVWKGSLLYQAPQGTVASSTQTLPWLYSSLVREACTYPMICGVIAEIMTCPAWPCITGCFIGPILNGCLVLVHMSMGILSHPWHCIVFCRLYWTMFIFRQCSLSKILLINAVIINC